MRGLQNIYKKEKYSIYMRMMIWMLLILLTSMVSPLTARATESEAAVTESGAMGEEEEAVAEMVEWLTGQMAEGAMTTESDIRAAIALGEEKLGIQIPEAMTEALIKSVDTMQSLGLGSDFLTEQVANLWQEYGDEITGEAGKGLFTMIWEAIKNFFAGIWKFIVDFVTGLWELIF